MRIATLAFRLEPNHDESRRLIRDVWRITDHSDEAYAGALAVVLAIRAALESCGKARASLAQIASGLPDTSVRDRLLAYAELPPTVPLAEVASRHGASGYVVESVPFALLSAQRIGELGFAGLLEQVIAAGGDTDTNASLVGQITGTALGLEGLPKDLVEQLPQAEMVLEIGREFAAATVGGP